MSFRPKFVASAAGNEDKALLPTILHGLGQWFRQNQSFRNGNVHRKHVTDRSAHSCCKFVSFASSTGIGPERLFDVNTLANAGLLRRLYAAQSGRQKGRTGAARLSCSQVKVVLVR